MIKKIELIKMTDKILKIVDIIANLPDPVNLNKVLKKTHESNDTLELEEAKKQLLFDYLNPLTSKTGVIIDHVKLMSVTSCPECGVEINNGFFKILLAESVPNEIIEIKQKIVMSYETLHNIETHGIYEKHNWATNESFDELLKHNNNKNPRDRLNDQELEKQIKKYSLEELDKILTEMMEKSDL